MKQICLILIWIMLGAAASLPIFGGDLKAEEIIAKHLEAIGKKDLRGLVKMKLVTGLSEFESKLPTVKGGGKGVIVSDPNNLYFLLSLNSKEYPFEKIGFFKNKVELPYVTAGERSPLGAFIAEHAKVLNDGLFLGTMTERWVLANPKGYGGRIFANGTKKINGRKAYTLEYYTSDGASSEFKIRIYIDAETFQHVRTEYDHEISPKEDKFGTLGTMGGAHWALVEDFGEYKDAEGLQLPYLYQTKFTSSGQSGTYEYIWRIRVVKYYFNQQLAPDFYSFEEK